MNSMFEIFGKAFGQLNLGEKIFLAAILLGCIGLVAYSICRVVRYSRSLEAIESKLLELGKDSDTA